MKNCRNTIRTLNIGVFSLACVYRHLVIQKSKGLQHAEKTSYGNSSGTRRRKARARDRNSWQARETSCLPRVGSVLRIDTASRRFVFRGDCLEPCGSWLFGCLLAGPVRRGVDVLVWRDRVDSFSAVGKLCFAGAWRLSFLVSAQGSEEDTWTGCETKKEKRRVQHKSDVNRMCKFAPNVMQALKRSQATQALEYQDGT